MTVGTNALLEERGARTALIATRGFSDMLEIGRQDRPELYRLCTPKPKPLVEPEMRFEASERVGPDGVVEPLAEEEPRRLAELVRESGAESVAVCLLFSYLDPSHERRIAEHLRSEIPGIHVSASHEVLPRLREFERCSTTAIDAYLSPLLGRYLGPSPRPPTAAALPAPVVMQSSGGVAEASEAAEAGAWSVLSGPAGGAVGAGLIARAGGDGDAIGIDMGGTSCDVCVVEGRPRQADRLPRGRRDGWSNCRWSTSTRSAPAAARSAGATPAGRCASGRARPGPSRGPPATGAAATEPTVTDANLLLGVLAPDSTLAGGVALDAEAAGRAVGRAGRPAGPRQLETAEGIVRIANQEMVRALRVVTVERGVDPRRFALLPFGGAGPMHAAAIAAELEHRQDPLSAGGWGALGARPLRLGPAPRHDARR